MPYEVQTPVFEGPFDLLLHLILREQVDLYEVKLSIIVDAYLAELERLDQLDLEVATEFLLIAATLVELKSKRLLPGDETIDLDEELALWEERDLLLARLLECKTFKDVSLALRRLATVAGRSYARRAGPDERFLSLTPDFLAGVTPEQLRSAFMRAIEPKPVPKIDLDHVAPIRASVTDVVIELIEELPRIGRTTFRQLTAGMTERLEVIVRFLAVLELFKQGWIDIEQGGTFGQIELIWLGIDGTDESSILSTGAGINRLRDLVDAYEG